MAAFPIHFFAPDALSRRASVSSTPRIRRSPASKLFESLVLIRSTLGQFVLFLWSILAIGFSLLVMAGFFLPQM
jgi:hypothetical protein